MTQKPDIHNEAVFIEKARQAYDQLTGRRGVRVEYSMSGDHVLLTKPRTGAVVGLYSPSTGRFLDPRMAKVPARGSTKFKIEENTEKTMKKPSESF